jgi:uracil-DNA glycosylase
MSLMPDAYLRLAKERASRCPDPYRQPEDFGYQFGEWVSPYTKGAHRFGGIALVLQDWASSCGLSGPHDPRIQYLGRDPSLLTNRVLEHLLWRSFRVRLVETYATNIFPWVKPGGMSARIPMSDALHAAKLFAAKELELVQPSKVLALGRLPAMLLRRLGISCVRLPHPAARISTAAKVEVWIDAARCERRTGAA